MSKKKIVLISAVSVLIIGILVTVLLLNSGKKDKSEKDSLETTTAQTDIPGQTDDPSSTTKRTDDEQEAVSGPVDGSVGSRLLLSASSPPSLDGFIQAPGELIGTPGVDFKLLDTGDADDWDDIPVPFINPLGSKSLYNNVTHGIPGSGYVMMAYFDGYTEVSHRSYGHVWSMRIRNNDLSMNYIRWYAKEIGATLYDNADNRVTFSIEENNRLWWATAVWDSPDSNQTTLTVTKQDILSIGQVLELTPDDTTGGNYRFTTIADSGDFLTAIIDIEGENIRSEVRIEGWQYISTGMLMRRFDYSKTMYLSQMERYSLNDIPQTDQPVSWRIQLPSGREPEKITIRFEKSGSIEPIRVNDQLGSIKVIGAPGSARVTDQSSINTITYEAGFSYRGINDSEGNTVFYLPAGYYNIRTLLPGLNVGGIRMVPVSGGELTEVILPEEFKSTYAAMESIYGGFETNDGSISILNNEDFGDTAKVSILVNDPQKRDIFPEKENIIITEGGEKGEITNITREIAPVDIVLVIDTSGSMQPYMQTAINAAVRFVEGLPDDTNIRLVSFARIITTHSAQGKEEVIKAIKSLNAAGSTALYDATDVALKMLEDMENAYVVLFSDGADSREPGVLGTGSNITQAQIIQRIAATDLSVLAIGFSEHHDPDALIAMCEANGKGEYFSALDEDMLDNAFAAVSAKFGNRFIIEYKRPEVAVDVRSQEPVISVIIDDSGSMGVFRQSVISLFYDFFNGIPEGTLLQLGKFADSLDLMQITTDEKALILQAMGERGQTGGSGTKVISALSSAMEQIKPLPTDKRVLIFLSDEAMSEVTTRWNRGIAEKIFEGFKKEGVRCLFIGVAGAARAEESYKFAAEMTGGEYIITNELKEIERVLQELLDKVEEPFIDKQYIPFSIGIRAPTEDGSIMDYFATRNLFDFSQKISQGQTVEPRTPRIITGGRMIPLFDNKVADLMTGGNDTGDNTVVLTSRITYEKPEPQTDPAIPSTPTDKIEYNKKGSNEFLEITVKEAYTFDVLSGVDAGRNNQFIALEVELAFPEQDTKIEAYRIPSIMQHFYLSLNNTNPMPASNATWLAASPLANPGEKSITIQKGGTIKGALVFHTTDPETITQLGFHFYDILYGHIHIPLTGRIRDHMTQIEELPRSAPASITDAFTMTVTGISDVFEYGSYKPVIDKDPDDPQTLSNTVLRTVRAVFDSQVQALLKLDPMKRFFYAINTDQGILMTRMNSMVHNIPLGFTGDTMVAPAASNTVFMPYEVPAVLSDTGSYIFGDVKSAELSLPVLDGSIKTTYSKGIKLSHEYFDVTINDLSYSPFRNRTIVLDITIHDKKDGYSTSGIHRAFALEHKTETNQRYKFIEGEAAGSLYGIDSDWIAYDGQSRRGVLLFDIREDLENYVLKSIHFPELELGVDNRVYGHPEFLAKRNDAPVDDSFKKELDRAVTAAIARYRASRSQTDSTDLTIAFSQEDEEGTVVPSPESSVFGHKVLNAIESTQDFYHVMYAIKWLPPDNRKLYYYAPEAVITQGWGTHWDTIILAENILSRLGIKTNYREVALTQRGMEALMSIGSVDDIGRTNSLPALAYVDDNGNNRMFVVPFMRDITELAGLVYLPHGQSGKKPDPATVKLTITAITKGDPERSGLGHTSLFDAFSKAATDTDPVSDEMVEKEVILLSENMSIPSLSLGAVDIGYYAAVKSESGGDIIKTVVETTDGLIQGFNGVDTGLDEMIGVRVQLEFSGSPKDGYIHTTWLQPGDKITDICHTLAFSLPELSQKAVSILEQESNEAAKAADDNTNNASIVKWFNRSTIYRYMAARTDYDKYMSQKLDLVMGRTSHPMALMITTRSDGVNAMASVDLMHHYNQIIKGEKDNINAYRLLSGMYASILEGNAIADGAGINMLDLWKVASEKEGFLYIENSPEARQEALVTLQDKFPERLLDNIQKAIDTRAHTIFFVPKVPGLYKGESRWAWLEIDARTYDAISVFDTGERAGLAGYAMGLMSNKQMQGYVGFFVGVNCAAWSISAYSLVMDDPQDIKDAAAILCADILKQLKEMLGVAGSKGAVDYFGGKIKGNVSVKGVSISDVESILSPKVQTPGFVDGFEAAISIYFD